MCILAALPVPDSILRTLPFASSRARACFRGEHPSETGERGPETGRCEAEGSLTTKDLPRGAGPLRGRRPFNQRPVFAGDGAQPLFLE
jgi:hypothetical protein